jgi:hypothetical protein
MYLGMHLGKPSYRLPIEIMGCGHTPSSSHRTLKWGPSTAYSAGQNSLSLDPFGFTSSRRLARPHAAGPLLAPLRPAAPCAQVGIRFMPFGGFLSNRDSHPYGLFSYLMEELNRCVGLFGERVCWRVCFAALGRIIDFLFCTPTSKQAQQVGWYAIRLLGKFHVWPV